MLWGEFDGVDDQVHPPVMASYVAVKLYGPGHVVAFNHISDFHDSINVETYGNPDGSMASGPEMHDGPKYPPQEYWDRRPVAIDFYNNYLANSHDNPIETDGSLHNVRVMRNMFINTRHTRSATSPCWADPSTGSATSPTTYPVARPGYAMAQPACSSTTTPSSPKRPACRRTRTGGTTSSLGQHALSDFRGERPKPVRSEDVHQLHVLGLQRLRPRRPRRPFRWDSPPFGVVADFRTPDHEPVLETREYATLTDYSAATGQDGNSILVDYDVFIDVPRLDARDASTRQNLYDANDLDFRLQPDSVAVESGTPLPTVTDGFTGRAPDLGALEVGVETPHYGPRP